MPWIRIDTNLTSHPKLLRLAKLLEVPRPQALGYLVSLWAWCLEYAPDGDLSAFSAAEVAEAVGWPGKPERFLLALRDCGVSGAGFLDPTGKLHDWEEYGGKLVEWRKKDQERARAYRNRLKQVVGRTYVPRDLSDEVYERDGYACIYCGSSEKLVIGRVVPFTRGGDDHPENLAPACRKCHARKVGRLPEEVGLTIISQERRDLHARNLVRLGLRDRVEPDLVPASDSRTPFVSDSSGVRPRDEEETNDGRPNLVTSESRVEKSRVKAGRYNIPTYIDSLPVPSSDMEEEYRPAPQNAPKGEDEVETEVVGTTGVEECLIDAYGNPVEDPQPIPAEVMEYAQQEWAGWWSPAMATWIRSWLYERGATPSQVLFALRETAERGKRSRAYASRIVQRLVEEGVDPGTQLFPVEVYGPDGKEVVDKWDRETWRKRCGELDVEWWKKTGKWRLRG